MKTVSSRGELNNLRGIRPAPAPPEPQVQAKPDPVALAVEAALRENAKQLKTLSDQGADTAVAMRTIAVAIARAIKQPALTLEAEIVRDREGRMSRIIITRKPTP
jgi:hypothetical protein